MHLSTIAEKLSLSFGDIQYFLFIRIIMKTNHYGAGSFFLSWALVPGFYELYQSPSGSQSHRHSAHPGKTLEGEHITVL